MRRIFLKKSAKLLAGGLFSLLAIPKLTSEVSAVTYPLGIKQARLLQAAKTIMERSGMLRSLHLFQYSNNGEVLMDWNLVIPPEENIDQNVDHLSQQILTLLGAG